MIGGDAVEFPYRALSATPPRFLPLSTTSGSSPYIPSYLGITCLSLPPLVTMRCLLTASLVFATLAGSVYGHGHDNNLPLRRRKTLGFGPDHPHAVYKSNPYQIQTAGFTPLSPSTDPLDVARLFVSDVLGVSGDHGSWKIRKDTYTDENTGVTHVYVRQVVNGLEVADGDMNINIKDGRVLSYGNSVCIFTLGYFKSFESSFSSVLQWPCSSTLLEHRSS